MKFKNSFQIIDILGERAYNISTRIGGDYMLDVNMIIAFYQDHHQTTFRVMEASEVRRFQRIPRRQVLQEIFGGKFIELKNGMLRYKK